ncbi:hypothetical protein A3A54_01230 [Candidatus Curtissbacteria bacterium RIFCSPLOWO2_01_FULL_39_62]|uniref:Uncharacterized protein n=2 Tax=Candidatus Curtissiibacteriota TaxID=1752717 RepID=A0A1F5GB81_9BACT|nr:MAG: hypothetical protein A3D04_00445 [Candidatus Curtissbacteria bacterium RIFCSPHIGHO2_02_FULL_40_16b]OGD90613.1 MAG: hypothetical protein A3E11_01795 [Candidatus Curtissbacteria bacterium RIFCSPHIGHO2_12_FULL_38_37]OGE00320.1 MAG: hypothetical protein A3J17_01450 [Candidatus Curtissbacteria bacterium RIFCSPLOWO2_02_FULL_40_11]OGE00464.1 MAG: hypothetical protein A3A54_01230 [Candidatus Curtissbacteria bacterium RIFCSPLOWO2_01_FULL_39_62]OGE14301.1 MAG: hypothetical protein A3G14_04015 [Ca
MTRVSKYYVDKKMLAEIDIAFKWLITSINKYKAVDSFVNDFFTDEERLMFAKRLFVGYLVAKGLGYKDIVSLI